MKMVKSLLLGSAAGLVAVGGAQAADLPVKAKPVEYVKICTLYGEGYYYIPGSDTCIKIGGYIQAQYGWNTAGGRNPAYGGTQGAQDRTVSQFSTRHRAAVQMDTRTQTSYGTLRTFTSLLFQQEDQTFSQNVQRGFIQWAGFTFGHAESYSDTWTFNDSYEYQAQQNNSDTGAVGVNQIAYTWELGNGMTLTVGADEVRRKSLTNLSSATALKIGAEPSNSFIGQRWPDPHIDFKVNQAWGFLALSGVAHDVSATYYSAPGTGPFAPPATTFCTGTAQHGTTQCDHPGDEVGWVVNGGGEFRLDFITPGDRFGFNARYAVGASGYGGGGSLTSGSLFDTGNQLAWGALTDGTFVNGSGIELTTLWTAEAAFEHNWTPQLKTSIGGGYTHVSYNSTATGWMQTQLGGVCTPAGATGAAKSANLSAGAVNNCDPDWSYFQGGIRTQWSPVAGFYMGVNVIYSRVWTGFQGDGSVDAPPTGAPARPTGAYKFDDFGNLGVIFRAQRAFNTTD
jgi:hypothetical protein